MSDEFERTRFAHDAALQQKPAEFQEAPGEAEADAARDAFLKGAGAQPHGVASALSGADAAMRSHALSRLQQERGNSYVQRVVAEAKGTPGRLVGSSQPEMVDEVLQRKGSGEPMPEVARQPLEQHFGADLGGVRVHSDGESAALNRELDAQAFTVGGDIFFADGKYNPSSSEGQGLLAHELTHVGQQTGFGGQSVQREGAPEEEETLQRLAVQRQATEEENPNRPAASAEMGSQENERRQQSEEPSAVIGTAERPKRQEEEAAP
jgi:uncharacterized protein DUF4157